MLSLGDRMKVYEDSTNFKIIPRAPIIARLDGRAFSHLAKKLKLSKPYDVRFSRAMEWAAKAVAEEVQGCMIGYTQSDEMTFVIRSDQSFDTTPWFDNRVQKMCSIMASIASLEFNEEMPTEEMHKKRAVFDCRVHPVPDIVEAMNSLVWRQQDCIKNAISGACYYEVGRKVGKGTARKLMHGLNQEERMALLLDKAEVKFASQYPAEFVNGLVIFKEEYTYESVNGPVRRKRWIAGPAPVFTSEDGWSWLKKILDGQADGQEEKKEIQ